MMMKLLELYTVIYLCWTVGCEGFQAPAPPSSSLSLQASTFPDVPSTQRRNWLTGAAVTGLSLLYTPPAEARLDSVNRPELLPSQFSHVIQTEKFLTSGQANRMNELLTSLEKDTGFRIYVLCQAYPLTPGLAIRDYWKVGGGAQQTDENYAVLVVDQTLGNALHFNVGDGVALNLPNQFWTRLAGQYGTTFYIRENGIDFAVVNAIDAIVTCLRSPEQYCVSVPSSPTPSLKSLGLS